MDHGAVLPLSFATLKMNNEGDGALWGPVLDPFFEPKIVSEDENYIIKREKDGSTIRINNPVTSYGVCWFWKE